VIAVCNRKQHPRKRRCKDQGKASRLTTALVILAWTTNLVAKPMATIFGDSVTLLGMGIAFFTSPRKIHQLKTDVDHPILFRWRKHIHVCCISE
jgi:hypothetical protein